MDGWARHRNSTQSYPTLRASSLRGPIRTRFVVCFESSGWHSNSALVNLGARTGIETTCGGRGGGGC